MGKNSEPERVQQVVLLRGPADSVDDANLDRLGHTCAELPQLYQLVKETRIDLILYDESRTDLTPAVAARIRRVNGLTEIWMLAGDKEAVGETQDHVDGVILADIGVDLIEEKIAQILRTKQLLATYGIVGRSARMKAVAEAIERVAPSDMAVLIVGPSGSGKELVAKAVHNNSDRGEHPYVAINCGALAPGLLESELFGHAKGAFTGSVGRREGLFGKADGGTLFLDEIGETSGQMQVKLLRVLEDGTYYPVGSSSANKTDVRVVSATNRDLTEAIDDRRFREDLYFRIAVVRIVLPPLLERKSDILPLLQHFWRDNARLTCSDSALDLLARYDWPGNIRQLRNFADRMLALKGKGLVEVDDVQSFLDEQQAGATHLPIATGKTVEEAGHELIYHAILSLGTEVRILRDLITAHLPGDNSVDSYDEAAPGGPASSLEEMEEELIRTVLVRTNGNRKEAATILGIGERTLYRKLKKYRLS
ncbi:MAG: sigma-54 dependent transcriptional regulator [candidate division Zixibacteria bacterium]|nr:sigma-54 dependent transcriptional regulator [candidate division Zixibacteria bacterium]MDH3937150.1 sigma-54 dependent transcriptional regulator [candidate division Zixibacteria bacterium]MDH4033404.1 sigma-54 dependent transcriptional regulator [candidate division Zixibacteria bacterium]